MAARLLNDPDQDGWERSDFPIVCETCLGPNPYVRMQRIEFGGTCHISGRPYTVFRWRPGNDARYKKTIICQEVAKAKNVCQVCLLDLEYGLPVQVRDTALGMTNDDIPESAVGKEYQLNQQAKDGTLDSSFAEQRPNDMLLKLQRTTPYYQRNKAQICSFFVRGECKRGAECPYRHEMPTTGELANQNIKDRYYGVNDPVANKMLRRLGDMPALVPPEDTTITTLYVGGLTAEISEDDLRDQFYHFGEIASVKKVPSKFCAFVTFASRAAAEKAAEEMQNKLIVNGVRLKLLWGKPQQPREDQQQAAAGPGRPAMLPPQVQAQAGGAVPMGSGNNFFNLPAKPFYPSMDPQAMGTRMPAPGDQQQSRKQGSTAAEEEPEAKRARAEGSGYGAPPVMRPPMHAPPGFMHPPGMMPPPPQMMPPPGGFRMPVGPPPGVMPPPAMPPPAMPPPRPLQPPAGGMPPAAAAPPPPQQQQQPGGA